MPIRMNGLASGIDPKLVDALVEAEKIPIETAKKRREKVVNEKKEFEKLGKMINDLETAVNSLKAKQDFYKMKVESSHPDIIDGTCTNDALEGSYEFEVRGLARTEKELAFGFPDKDKTEVGFGYLMIEREDFGDEVELTIEPGSTLQDVVKQINDANLGVRALIVNTKYKPDAYRLLVISNQSGNEARLSIDPDTTFLEFKEQVTGTNLDVLFEDVPVTDVDNKLDELIDGVVFDVKRPEPGTRVTVNIVPDIDKTMEGIKSFVDKYNAIASFVHSQFEIDPETKKAKGLLSGDSAIKQILRSLQGALQNNQQFGSKFNTIADIGITTDPKSGNLRMDEAKVRQALSEDYKAVAQLFIRDLSGQGLMETFSGKIRGFRDPTAGVLRSRIRALDGIIKNQDRDIENRERNFESKEASIRRRFSALEGQMANLNQQGALLAQRFAASGTQGGGGGQPQGGGG